MTRAQQERTVSEFKSGITDILVATRVAEEGLDIGEVDMVMLYDSTASGTRSIQRMGRTGRQREGRVVVLSTEEIDSNKFQYGNDRVTDFISLIRDQKDLLKFFKRSPRLIPSDITRLYLKSARKSLLALAPPDLGSLGKRDSHSSTNSDFLVEKVFKTS